MLRHLRQYPLFVLITMIGALAMLLPATQAARVQDWPTARVFLQSALLVLVLSVAVGLALMNRRTRNVGRSHLLTLVLAYTLLPFVLAIPLMELVPNLTWIRGWFEMVSSLTTTGATVFPNPAILSDAMHLWRGVVGWMGGLLILLAAFSVMQPLNIGGFEVRGFAGTDGIGGSRLGQGSLVAGSDRVIGIAMRLTPIYAIATLVLMLALVLSGERVLVAAIHAMSIISTSGISPVGGLSGAEAGLMGEVLMALFLLLAVSVHGYSPLSGGWRLGWLRRDPQIRIMVLVVLGVPLFLLLRHLISSGPLGTWSELRAIWASMFTSLSYLTTTGFESAWWPQARAWQELSSPVLLLMALAVTGGGVATTAGGVKLLRVYALYRHATRETERMLHPNSVTRAPGSGQEDRRLRRSGAQIAWAFVVLFALALVVTALLLGLTGASFGESLVLSASALSNTGPLASASGGLPPFSRLGDSALAILGLAMGLGRIEILALISLVNPDYWRR